MNRRDLLKGTLLAGAALKAWPSSALGRSSGGLDLLILGGTSFLGPHQVRCALERGHRVSIFTRGKTQPLIHTGLFDHVEHLVGDRDGNLKALEGRRWDAVIDHSGQRVAWAKDAAELLKDAANQYLYVSSTGVYYPYHEVDIAETSQPMLADVPPQDPPSFGVMKARSEIAVRQAFGNERTTIVRPQYIVGPGDLKDRFTYWPQRIARGGEVLVPGSFDDPIQWIDVRDLTEWMIRLLEQDTTGTFNAVGPSSACGMAEFVHGVRAATSAPVTWTWIDDRAFLKAQGLTYSIPWLLPDGEFLGAARINNRAARNAGLTFRPLAQTCMDTLAWWESDQVTPERRDNPTWPLSVDRERVILEAWRLRG